MGIGTATLDFRIELLQITTTGTTAGRGRAVAWETYASGRWKGNVEAFKELSREKDAKIKALEARLA